MATAGTRRRSPSSRLSRSPPPGAAGYKEAAVVSRTLPGTPLKVAAGELALTPANRPHAVHARPRFKVRTPHRDRQALGRHAVGAREFDQLGHQLRMCMDVKDIARDLTSRHSRHERFAPEAELRFGLAVRLAVGEHK